MFWLMTSVPNEGGFYPFTSLPFWLLVKIDHMYPNWLTRLRTIRSYCNVEPLMRECAWWGLSIKRTKKDSRVTSMIVWFSDGTLAREKKRKENRCEHMPFMEKKQRTHLLLNYGRICNFIKWRISSVYVVVNSVVNIYIFFHNLFQGIFNYYYLYSRIAESCHACTRK